jgi:hypothetical protein
MSSPFHSPGKSALRSCVLRYAALLSVITAFYLVMGYRKSEVRAEMRAVYYSPPADRAWAVRCLAWMKSRKAIPLFIKLCNDPDGGVRETAMDALGMQADASAIPVLETIARDNNARSVKGVTTCNREYNVSGEFNALDQPEFMRSDYGLDANSTYDLRYAARQALMKMPGKDGAPREPVEMIADLAAIDFAALHRLEAHRMDRQYQNSEQGNADNQVYSAADSTIRIIERSPHPNVTAALARLLGCGLENIELLAAYSMAKRPAAEVLPQVRNVLRQPDISALTLSACLSILAKQDVAAAPIVARRLTEKCKVLSNFDRFPHIMRPLLKRFLNKNDVALVKDLRDTRQNDAERAMVAELIDVLEGRAARIDYFEAEDAEITDADRDDAIRCFLSALKPGISINEQWKPFKAMYHLGRLKVKEAIPLLWPWLRDDGMASFGVYREVASSPQAMAAWALVQLADPGAIPVLRDMALHHPTGPFVTNLAEKGVYARGSAIVAYARLAKAAAIVDLAKILSEPDFRCKEGGLAYGYRLPAFPNFNSVREAAAFALSEAGGADARRALVDYLHSGEPLTPVIIEAIHRLDAEALDQWSLLHFRNRDWARTSSLAVSVRFVYYPDASGPLALSLMNEKPAESVTLLLLNKRSFHYPSLTRKLIEWIGEDKGKEVLESGREPRMQCNQRIKLITALARQGGKDAENALIEFAATGKIALK